MREINFKEYKENYKVDVTKLLKGDTRWRYTPPLINKYLGSNIYSNVDTSFIMFNDRNFEKRTDRGRMIGQIFCDDKIEVYIKNHKSKTKKLIMIMIKNFRLITYFNII